MTVIYILVLALFIISLCVNITQSGPLNATTRKGYMQPGDSVATMLDRVQWSNQHHGRINYICRYFTWAVPISFMVSIVFLNRLPDSVTFVQVLLVVWISLLSYDSFFNFHADKFSSYTVDQNIKGIRKALGYMKGYELSEQTEKFPGHSDCFTFDY